MKNLAIIILMFVSIYAPKAFSQDNVGLRFVFATVHPEGEKNALLMPLRLDERAVIVLNWGFIGSYERYIYKKRIALKVAQGAYSDCAQLFAGHTHVAFRANLLNSRKHSLEVGFGPTFVYRKSWYRFPEYEQETKLLKKGEKWQWNFVWYGGEVEYDYALTNKMDLTVNCIPGFPKFFTFAVGTRYWFRPIPASKDWPKKRTKIKESN